LLSSQGEQLGVPLFETLGTRTKRSLSIRGNQRGEKTSELPRGWLRPMDQPLGHKMRVGVTSLLFTCSIKSDNSTSSVDIMMNQTASALELLLAR
jgi:hypothetical protein